MRAMLHHVCSALGFSLWLAVAAFAAPTGQRAETLRIVGGLALNNQFQRLEAPFWSHELERLSQGRFTAEIVPFDRAGVPAVEMLRLIQYGVIPFGTALLSNVSTPHPDLAAPDLAGLNPDMASLRRNLAAFRPYLERVLRSRHGIELLAVYTYPAQMLFCKRALAGLNDLAGRRIRVSSATQADLVTALRASPVLVAYGNIAASLNSGDTECAITGTMSGNTLGLHEITSHLYAMPITWGLALFAANQNAWEALPGDLRALLRRELPRLEAAIWAESERETSEGVACNIGAATCQSGRKGQMRQQVPGATDEARRRELLTGVVLPRWLKRCGPSCQDLWQQTLGPVTGIRLEAPVP